jgi:hypothetical protein
MKKAIFWFSITLNILFLLRMVWNSINAPSEQLGILKQDIDIGHFMDNKKIFTLPKGLTVKNQSQRGISAIGQFENNRFSIVITSEKALVDYNVAPKKLNPNGNFYSAKLHNFLIYNQ